MKYDDMSRNVPIKVDGAEETEESKIRLSVTGGSSNGMMIRCSGDQYPIPTSFSAANFIMYDILGIKLSNLYGPPVAGHVKARESS